MKQFHWIRILLAFFLLFACTTMSAAAFTVSSVNTTPGGFQPAGTAVTVVSVLNFPAAGATTFPPDSELHLSTDLVDPSWVPVVAVDGNETPRDIISGKEMTLPGAYLSFLPSQSVQLTVKLSGKIPSDRHPGENIVKIQERDSKKNIVSAHEVAMPEVPLAATIPPVAANGSAATKTSAPLPAETTPASPAWAGAAVAAMAGAAWFAGRRD